MRKQTWISVSKLDAARRQVDAAITLFFADGDPVAMHTLLYASVDILHGLYKRATGEQLLFDNKALKGRPEITALIHRWPNFFKHGRRKEELDSVLDFNPEANMILFSACMAGLTRLRAPQSDLLDALAFWMLVHHPDYFPASELQKRPSGYALRQIRRIGKKRFLEHCSRIARKRRRAASVDL